MTATYMISFASLYEAVYGLIHIASYELNETKEVTIVKNSSLVTPSPPEGCRKIVIAVPIGSHACLTAFFDMSIAIVPQHLGSLGRYARLLCFSVKAEVKS